MMKSAYNLKEKFSNAINNISLWTLAFFVAWILGKLLLWPLLEFFFSWLRPDRTNDLLVNAINETLFESRVILMGTICTTAFLFFTTFKIESRDSKQIKTKVEAITVLTVLIMTSGYLCMYWLYQSAYWWYISPLSMHAIYANLLIYYNIIKAIGTLCILTFEPWRFIVVKFMKSYNENKAISKQLFGIRAFVYGLLCLLYFWSSIPNKNLGLPATIIFAGFIIFPLIQYLWAKFSSKPI